MGDDKVVEPKDAVHILIGGKLMGSGPMGGMPMGGMPMGGMPMSGVPMGGGPRGGVSIRGPRMPGGMGNSMMDEMLNKRKSMRVAPTNASIEEAIKVRKSKSIEEEKNSEAGNASKTDNEPEKKKDEKKQKGFMSGL